MTLCDRAFDAFIALRELKEFTPLLPFPLAGVASSDEVAARSLAFRRMDNFDSSNPDAHHRVAMLFLSGAQVGGYRHALQEWARDDLPN